MLKKWNFKKILNDPLVLYYIVNQHTSNNIIFIYNEL